MLDTREALQSVNQDEEFVAWVGGREMALEICTNDLNLFHGALTPDGSRIFERAHSSNLNMYSYLLYSPTCILLVLPLNLNSKSLVLGMCFPTKVYMFSQQAY